MSYKTQSHSLAEQVTNLADVYSSVEEVPLAKAEIRRDARVVGRTTSEGTAAVEVAKVVDAYTDYFGAATVEPDPRTGSPKTGWWNQGYSSFGLKSLKHAVKTAWSRRSIRLKTADEDTRTIRGRSSSQEPVVAEVTSVVAGRPPFINGYLATIEFTPVYEDGSSISSGDVIITQSSAQESRGCELVYVSSAVPVIFAPVAEPVSFQVFLPGTLLSDTSGDIGLIFSIDVSGVEKAFTERAVLTSGALGSFTQNKMDIYVQVSMP